MYFDSDGELKYYEEGRIVKEEVKMYEMVFFWRLNLDIKGEIEYFGFMWKGLLRNWRVDFVVI